MSSSFQPPSVKPIAFIAPLALTLSLPLATSAQCPDGTQGSGPACAARRPAPIDTQAIVVLPFAVRGPADAMYLGDGMSDLFQMGLDGLGGYRLKHPSNVQQRLRDVKRPSDFGDAAPVVQSLGARYALGGSVVVLGQSVRVSAELFDVVSRRRVLPLVAQGDVDRLGSLIDSLAVTLVARGPLRSREAPGSGEFITRSPGALRAYMTGESLARSGAWRAAADSFQSSIRQDSSFGSAYLSLHRIVLNARVQSPPGLDAADLRHRRQFTVRIRQIRDITSTFRVRRAPGLEAVDRLAAQYPYDPEVAYLQAEVYFHVGRELGRSQEEVRVRIERSLELDGDRPEILEHYSSVLAESGDTAGALAAVSRALIAAPNDGLALAFEMAMKALFRGADPLALQRERPNPNADYTTTRLVPRDPARAISIADSFAGAWSVDSAPPLVSQRRWVYALGQGRYEAAWVLLDRELVRRPNGIGVPLQLVHALVTGGHLVEAAATHKHLLARADSLPLAWLSAVAWYSAVLGPTDSAERAIAALDRYRRADSAIAPAVAEGLRGFVALRAGDTAQARARFSKSYETHARQTNMAAHLFPSISISLMLARLELAAGDAKSAERRLHDAYPPHEAVTIVPYAEELRGRVYEALGDAAAAREAYNNVVKLLARADSQLVPMREAAQAALVRLSGRP